MTKSNDEITNIVAIKKARKLECERRRRKNMTRAQKDERNRRERHTAKLRREKLTTEQKIQKREYSRRRKRDKAAATKLRREKQELSESEVLICTKCHIVKERDVFLRGSRGRTYYRFCDICREKGNMHKCTQSRQTLFDEFRVFIDKYKLRCSHLDCAETEILEFDHIHRNTKKFKLTDTRKLYNICHGAIDLMKTTWLSEFKKCQVLCLFHHRVKSRQEALHPNPKRPRSTMGLRVFVDQLKQTRQKCIDCGIMVTDETMCAFDFDHVDPNTKSFTLARVGRSIHLKKNIIQLEAEKCVLRCANCHCRRTKQQKESKEIG